MRKLVLGIIALLTVQFAFVTYMMVLQQPAVVELAVAPSRTDPPRSELRGNVDSDNAVEVEREVVASSAPEQPLVRRVATTARPSKRPAFPPASRVASSGTEFKTVVIRYNRDPDRFNCDTPDLHRSKKRSYLAKATPVVKKPLDWIKAIGSKLK